jgi:hypothetical protein
VDCILTGIDAAEIACDHGDWANWSYWASSAELEDMSDETVGIDDNVDDKTVDEMVEP